MVMVDLQLLEHYVVGFEMVVDLDIVKLENFAEIDADDVAVVDAEAVDAVVVVVASVNIYMILPIV